MDNLFLNKQYYAYHLEVQLFLLSQIHFQHVVLLLCEDNTNLSILLSTHEGVLDLHKI